MRLLSRNISLLLMSVLALATIVTVANGECAFKDCLCVQDPSYRVDSCKTIDGNFPERVLSEQPEHIDLIDMSYGAIKSIPDNHFNGLKVHYFDLDTNKLTELKANAFANAEVLMLVLSRNEIRHIDRNAFTPLKDSLKTLLLFSNKLSEMAPEDLAAVLEPLEQLTTLSLKKNHLTYIPDLSHMVKCSDLQLSSNHITSLIQTSPDKFLLPDNLYSLSVDNNRIKNIDARMFQNLRKLKHLNLASNQIEHIDPDTFKYLTNLRSLDLRKNDINAIQGGTFRLQALLTRLDLSSQNNMLKKIDNYAFDRETDSPHMMEVLDLSNNRIERLPPKAFCSKRAVAPYLGIKTLDLAANHIKNLNPCLMRQLSKGAQAALPEARYVKPIVKLEVNNAIHTVTEFIKCDCNVTYAARLVTLEGNCKNDERTNIKLKNYQCGIINALGTNNDNMDIDELCNSSPMTSCEETEGVVTSSQNEHTSAGSHFSQDIDDVYNTKTDKPHGQVNVNDNTHTSSNNDRKVTVKPSQIGGSPSSAPTTYSVARFAVLLTSALSTYFLFIRL